jgi:hypothetical protein
MDATSNYRPIPTRLVARDNYEREAWSIDFPSRWSALRYLVAEGYTTDPDIEWHLD